ncbi:hypothetical protein BD779DRAFT_1610089 [Infundibulicybe gibba]|nr:hypothetical protein BD779DRAFT_1610089 [Infundibulicybe gibba]
MIGPLSITLSEFLGYTSITCWLGAQFPQVLENLRRQSCEGLALPFLVNWLLGDFSNLVGCIMTHQLPFQTYLATYFVFVDCTLMAQYAYYSGAKPQPPSTPFPHVRSATLGSTRRVSGDRGSRYRTMSAVAANVAAAAALVAQDDSRQGNERRSGQSEDRLSTSRVSRETTDLEEGAVSGMMESFHSERGYDTRSKRVSWSMERCGGRGGSVGRHSMIGRNAGFIAPHTTSEAQGGYPGASIRGRTLHRDEEAPPVTKSVTPGAKRRSSRASRRGATMVFLGVWALFSVGTLSGGQRGLPAPSSSLGRVLTSEVFGIPEPITTAIGSSKHNPEPLHPSVLGDASHPHEPHRPHHLRNGLSMYLFIFAFLGNVFYVSSILTSPKMSLPPPQALAFIKESVPYLLGSAGTLMFDITIVSQSFIYRPRPRRRLSTRGRVAEEEGLLAGDILAQTNSVVLHLGNLRFPITVPGSKMASPPLSTSTSGSSSQYAKFSNPTPYQLRSLVLDYLCQHCYTKTAKAFARDSTIKHIDPDGDELLDAGNSLGSSPSALSPNILKQMETREQIRSHLLSGQVEQAITMLDANFPSVLSLMHGSGANPPNVGMEYIATTSINPEHLILNLRILAWIEACRTIPLEPPAKSAANETSPVSPDPEASRSVSGEDVKSDQELQLLVSKMRKLYALANMLSEPADRAAYIQELRNVGGLLGYKVPETSSMAKYLSQERREAVADQIDTAILCRTGLPPISSLELLTRYTATVWMCAQQMGLKPRPGVPVPPFISKLLQIPRLEKDQVIPPFDLQQFLDLKP